MQLHAFWPYFILVAAVVGMAAMPVFRFIDTAPNADARYTTIDGLRGFLALSVFVFHLVVTHAFIETGKWELPESRLYALLGPIGVSLFFMITGFLFWGKLLRAQGRPRWRELYIGRLFRIGPLYLFVVLVMLYIVFVRTGFEPREPASAVISSALQWLALGILNTQPDVNGYPATHVLAGVTWTITYEWGFYASLMLTAYFARGRAHLFFVLVAILVCLAEKSLLDNEILGITALFVAGMLVASLVHEKWILPLSKSVSSALALACLVFIFSTSHNGYGTLTMIVLTLFFYLVCTGASLFGLLTSMPARRLGNISYGLYLMQGLVLTLIYSIPSIRSFALESAFNYWVVGFVCAGALVLAAALGYAFIERPGIALGKRIIQRRAGPRPAIEAEMTICRRSSLPHRKI